MFYTINSSPLLINFLGGANYQTYPVHFKTLDTIGNNGQRPLFSLCVFQQQTCAILCSVGRRICEIIMQEKNTLVTRCVLDFETSKSNSVVSKSNSWKITSLSKTMLLQREPFLTLFYTINSHYSFSSKVLC